MTKKKLRNILSVGILVVTGGLFAQAVLAADYFRIDKCVGYWSVEFWWTKDDVQVGPTFNLDCDNQTDKKNVTRTGAAQAANDYHFKISDVGMDLWEANIDNGDGNGTMAECFFNGNFETGTKATRKVNCKHTPTGTYAGDLKINALEDEPD